MRALPLGVIMLRRNKRLRFANRAAAAIFGFDRARAKGLHLIETIPSIELERRVDAALSGEAVATAPLIVTGKRTDRSYAVTVYPLTISRRDDDEEVGEISGALILAEIKPNSWPWSARARSFFPTSLTNCARRYPR